MPALSRLREELQRLEYEVSLFGEPHTRAALTAQQRTKLSEIQERLRMVKQMLGDSSGGTTD
jgi:hypothetical protein